MQSADELEVGLPSPTTLDVAVESLCSLPASRRMELQLRPRLMLQSNQIASIDQAVGRTQS